MALLDWFPEIHLRLSTHYGYLSVLVTYLCGRTKVRNSSSVTTDGHQAPTATMSYGQNGANIDLILHRFHKFVQSV